VPLFLEDGSLPARQIDEQVESDYNRLLDDCNDFRDNLGEVSDNISLGVSMQHFWEDRCAQRADAYPDGVGGKLTLLMPHSKQAACAHLLAKTAARQTGKVHVESSTAGTCRS